MVSILKKLDKFVLGAKYNFVFRILQIAVIGAIMILGKLFLKVLVKIILILIYFLYQKSCNLHTIMLFS